MQGCRADASPAQKRLLVSRIIAFCGQILYAETRLYVCLCEVASPHKATLDKDFVHNSRTSWRYCSEGSCAHLAKQQQRVHDRCWMPYNGESASYAVQLQIMNSRHDSTAPRPTGRPRDACCE